MVSNTAVALVMLKTAQLYDVAFTQSLLTHLYTLEKIYSCQLVHYISINKISCQMLQKNVTTTNKAQFVLNYHAAEACLTNKHPTVFIIIPHLVKL